jgi:uracil-DNA glycosylase
MDFIIDETWKEILKEEFDKDYFLKLSKFLKREYQQNTSKIFPKKSEIFNAFNLCPLNNIKVVILGQDPYPTKGHAHGLSFSVKNDVRPIPKSLKNIFKELKDDIGVDKGENGCLTDWSRQGVLLLNTVMTVEESKPQSHYNIGWELFSDAVMRILNSQKNNLIYLLWGNNAIQKAHLIDAQNNLILKAPHPSPLSAYRGFLGCKHFSITNTYLEKMGKNAIEW